MQAAGQRETLEEEVREYTDDPSELEHKIQVLAETLKSAKRTVAFTGAGISTAAGLRSFRGDDGIWTQAVREQHSQQPPQHSQQQPQPQPPQQQPMHSPTTLHHNTATDLLHYIDAEREGGEANTIPLDITSIGTNFSIIGISVWDVRQLALVSRDSIAVLTDKSTNNDWTQTSHFVISTPYSYNTTCVRLWQNYLCHFHSNLIHCSDKETGNFVMTLEGHTSAVTDLICWEGHLVSSSNDHSVIIWNPDGTQYLKITEHSKSVLGLNCYRHILFTMADDKKTIIWNKQIDGTVVPRLVLQQNPGSTQYPWYALVMHGIIFSGGSKDFLSAWTESGKYLGKVNIEGTDASNVEKMYCIGDRLFLCGLNLPPVSQMLFSLPTL